MHAQEIAYCIAYSINISDSGPAIAFVSGSESNDPATFSRFLGNSSHMTDSDNDGPIHENDVYSQCDRFAGKPQRGIMTVSSFEHSPLFVTTVLQSKFSGLFTGLCVTPLSFCMNLSRFTLGCPVATDTLRLCRIRLLVLFLPITSPS